MSQESRLGLTDACDDGGVSSMGEFEDEDVDDVEDDSTKGSSFSTEEHCCFGGENEGEPMKREVCDGGDRWRGDCERGD